MFNQEGHIRDVETGVETRDLEIKNALVVRVEGRNPSSETDMARVLRFLNWDDLR